MFDYEQAVFISYAWGDEREEIVNQIDQALQKRGIDIIRDKRDLGYKGSIEEFMKRIGRGDCVIVVISDKYLRSPNCMFELVEIAENTEFRDRIFPVIWNDANIYDPIKSIEYIKYWEKKRKKLAEKIKTVDPAHTQGILKELELYDRIRGKISRLTGILKDMNALTPEMHKESNFKHLYNAIEKRMKENPKFFEWAGHTLNISIADDDIGIGIVQINEGENTNTGNNNQDISQIEKETSKLPTEAVAVCYKISKNNRIKFLLVKSSSKRWIFPKGKIEGDENSWKRARKEAQQEAGVKGKVDHERLTTFIHLKRNKEALLAAYLLRVKDLIKPKENRQHKWFSFEDAFDAVAQDRLPKYAEEYRRVLQLAQNEIQNEIKKSLIQTDC